MINLTYQAQSATEFKELVEWMGERGSASVSPSKASAGGERRSIEIEYLRLSKNQQMRTTKEERESGLDREQIAQARIEKEKLDLDSGEDIEVELPDDPGTPSY